MKRKFYLAVMIIVLTLALCACSVEEDGSVDETEIGTSEQNIVSEGGIEQSSQVTSVLADPNDVEVIEDDYSMSFYTEAPNQNSSIRIQYPNFIGDKADVLNKLVYAKVQELAKIDTSLFSSDARLTVDYQSEVTLQNEKIVSIIFWGSNYIEGGAYATNNLFSLNVDLQTMEEITFEELYSVDEDFEKIFFANAFFPTNPITSYDEVSFAEMLRLQSLEYQTISPFSISENVSCFLKSDGIVLSMPAIHATGNDHFEAQLKYSDIEKFYLAEQKYWEE